MPPCGGGDLCMYCGNSGTDAEKEAECKAAGCTWKDASWCDKPPPAKCFSKKDDTDFCGTGKVYDATKNDVECAASTCTTAADASKCCRAPPPPYCYGWQQESPATGVRCCGDENACNSAGCKWDGYCTTQMCRDGYFNGDDKCSHGLDWDKATSLYCVFSECTAAECCKAADSSCSSSNCECADPSACREAGCSWNDSEGCSEGGAGDSSCSSSNCAGCVDPSACGEAGCDWSDSQGCSGGAADSRHEGGGGACSQGESAYTPHALHQQYDHCFSIGVPHTHTHTHRDLFCRPISCIQRCLRMSRQQFVL